MMKDQIHQKIKNALDKIQLPTEKLTINPPNNESFGDYSTTIAMQLAKELKKDPFELAEKIAENIEIKDPIGSVKIIKPGFINVMITQKILLRNLGKIDDKYGNLKNNSDLKVMLEFTDPNPFKEMHIGHLYSNSIGESLSRLLQATGADVKRANYQGDVGMHVSKSIWGLRKEMESDHSSMEKLESKPLNERIKYLGKSYAHGATAYEEDKNAAEEMKNINYLVYASAQDVLKEKFNWKPQIDYKQYLGNVTIDQSEIKNIFEKGRAWSLEYFETIYQRLGTKFDFYYFESIVGEYGIKIVNEYLKKGVFEKSDNAVVFLGKKFGLHTRVFINSLGLPTYEAKELGLAPTKYKDFPYNLSIIITGSEINEYFKVLIAALKEVSRDLGEKTMHIGHGMVRLPQGKMSSRTGKIITGEWLLNEVQDKILKVIKKNNEIDLKDEVSSADILAVAAIKYSFLKGGIGNDIAFDFDDSLSLTGNSGPYLIYTYVRCKSVLNKSNSSNTVTPNSDLGSSNINKDELTLLRTLIKYPEVVLESAKNFAPNYLCTYLYDLSQKYNLFYQRNPILKAEDKKQKNLRLAITTAVAHVLKHGLNLLGIKTVEKM